jgi:hypothetical protein
MEHLAKMSEELKTYLTPRIIVSWLRQSDYGAINVPEDCPLKSLSKSGYGYSGVSNIQGCDYSFHNSPEEHVAAVISVALDYNIAPVEVKDVDLARLAKTIDLLVNNMSKSAPKAPANQFEHMETGQAIQPEEPIQPVPTQPATNKTNKTKSFKIPKTPGAKPKPNTQKPLKITKAESQKNCEICGQKMFLNEVFTGCTCFRPLAKNCKAIPDKNGFTITFDTEWDEDSVLSLIGAFKNG